MDWDPLGAIYAVVTPTDQELVVTRFADAAVVTLLPAPLPWRERLDAAWAMLRGWQPPTQIYLSPDDARRVAAQLVAPHRRER